MFHTIKEYVKFATAREFCPIEGGNHFAYQQNAIEKCGNALLPAYKCSDKTLQHIRDPNIIVASTIAALGLATLIFYPEKSTETFLWMFPFASMVKPWAVKLTMFVLTELHIIGFGLRTYGRLDNPSLIEAWRNKTIFPIPIGAVSRED